MIFENLTVIRKRLEVSIGMQMDAKRMIEIAEKIVENITPTEAQKAQLLTRINPAAINTAYNDCVTAFQTTEVIPDPDEEE